MAKVDKLIVDMIYMTIDMLEHTPATERVPTEDYSPYFGKQKIVFRMLKKFGNMIYSKRVNDVHHMFYEITDVNNHVKLFYVAEKDEFDGLYVSNNVFSITLLDPFK